MTRLILSSLFLSLITTTAYSVEKTIAADKPLAAIKADSDSPDLREKLAQEVLELTNARGLIEHSMGQSMEVATQQMPPELRDVVIKFTAKTYTWEKLGPKFAKLYTETFTAKELQDVVIFYKSEVGKNFIAKQPEIMTKTMAMIQEINQEAMPELMEEIKKVMPALPEPPAPAPAAAPVPAVK
ncbi:MAG: DUF2059 domain-containing protein [Proteobacteria bacterium]|nr:MAG: DUF2059 domain-containing protein [Pseudomonadota bacterium]